MSWRYPARTLAFRLELLAGSPRHRRVLELVAEKSGWARPVPRTGIVVWRFLLVRRLGRQGPRSLYW